MKGKRVSSPLFFWVSFSFLDPERGLGRYVYVCVCVKLRVAVYLCMLCVSICVFERSDQGGCSLLACVASLCTFSSCLCDFCIFVILCMLFKQMGVLWCDSLHH